MIPMSADHIEEVVLLHLYRQGTDSLIRHAILAFEHGDAEYADACCAEVKRRETQTERQAA